MLALFFSFLLPYFRMVPVRSTGVLVPWTPWGSVAALGEWDPQKGEERRKRWSTVWVWTVCSGSIYAHSVFLEVWDEKLHVFLWDILGHMWNRCMFPLPSLMTQQKLTTELGESSSPNQFLMGSLVVSRVVILLASVISIKAMLKPSWTSGRRLLEVYILQKCNHNTWEFHQLVLDTRFKFIQTHGGFRTIFQYYNDLMGLPNLLRKKHQSSFLPAEPRPCA